MKNDNKIIISSSTKNLSTVRNFIEEKIKFLNLDVATINQIILSVDEACTNIIRHTHNYDESKNIEIETVINKNKLQIILKYQGKGFDPSKKEVPDLKEYLKKYKVGGLGIPIIKKSMDEIIFDHTKKGINYLTLVKVF